MSYLLAPSRRQRSWAEPLRLRRDTTWAIGGSKSKQPKPSYDDGKLRDPSIEKMQDKAYQRGDLARLIRKATKGKAPEGA